jgi:CO dehydrogenase nickel-insertion accessory protein CooC1
VGGLGGLRGVRGAVSLTIAVAGREGWRSAAAAALILRGLRMAGVRPLLALDAAPFSHLPRALGMEPPPSLASLRDEFLGARKVEAVGEDLFEALVHQRVMEGEGIDLLVVGSAGAVGPASFLDSLMWRAVDRLALSCQAAVTDVGEGIDHLARSSRSVIDHLILVCGRDAGAAEGAIALNRLAARRSLRIQRRWLLLDHEGGGPEDRCRDGQLPADLSLLGEMPPDTWRTRKGGAGEGLLDLPGSSPAAAAVEKAVRERLLDRTGLDTRRIL